MGVMTVAPTAGIAIAPFDAVTRTRISCSACGTAAPASEPYCAHCGTRVSVAGKRGPASLAATRSLQFAVLVVLANIVVGGTSFGVVYLVSDAANLNEAALGLEAMRWLVVAILAVVAIRFGVRGLRETRDSGLRRRPWAIGGIAVSALFALLVTTSVGATALLFLLQP